MQILQRHRKRRWRRRRKKAHNLVTTARGGMRPDGPLTERAVELGALGVLRDLRGVEAAPGV